jgi:hypothetical protein
MEFYDKIPSTCPRQKLSISEKGETWGIDNMLWWEHKLVTGNQNIEADRINMKKNANLYFNNILDPIDVARVVNPHNIKDFVMPATFKHYKIENPKIQTLKGEELKRRFEWKVYVSNRDAVSKKEEEKKAQYFQFVSEKIKAEAFDEKSAEEELKKLQDYLMYDWQDIREKSADQLLQYYSQYLDLKTQYSRAWENALLYGHEIISVDEHNLKPVVESCDPKTIFWLRSPENPYIDDNSGIQDSTNSSNYLSNSFLDSNKYNFNGYYDSYGNIRVVHVRWKSMRKIGVLSYFDDQGNLLEMFVDEKYKVNKSLGETIRWIWITEAWEGTRIGEDIFIKIQPRNVQYRKMDNISYCSLGYVGTSIDNPIFELIKEYSIKYDAYMERTEQAMIKAIGKIGILDLSVIPDGWDVDMWMHFATNMGWAVKDSFKEGKKGAAMGKLAGSNNTNSDVINLEQGQFIQQNMAMLQYLEQQMDSLIGINKQRQGAVNSSAGLQVTREAVDNSSTITESYFQLHDNVKMRTLRMLLEVAKYCLRGKSESLQYVTSNFTNEIFNIDGDLVNEAEYDILVGDATNDAKTIATLQKAVEIALQTGAVDLIQLMDIFSTDSTSAIKRKVEKSVRAKQEQEQKNLEADRQVQQESIKAAAQQHAELIQEKQKDRDLKKYEIDTKAQVDLQKAEISALGFAEDTDVNDNMVPDVIEQGKLALEQQRFMSDSYNAQQKASYDKSVKDKEFSIKEKELKSKENIEMLKIKNTQIQNKNQIDLANKKAKLDKELADKKIKIEQIKARKASKAK